MSAAPTNDFWKLDRVDVFSTADHGGNPFVDTAYLDRIVENFDRFCKSPQGWEGIHYDPAAFRLPDLPADVGIGHDQQQQTLKDLLQRTDLLAGGWTKKLWREGNHLYANIENIPDELAQEIFDGTLRHVSAEFHPDFEATYDDADEEIVEPGYGPALKRTAFLGASAPRIKDLDPIPMPTRMELAFGESGGPVIICLSALPMPTRMLETFSEPPTPFPELTMDRNAIIQSLQALGFDVSKITDADQTDLLQEILSKMQNPVTPEVPPPGPDPTLNNAKFSEIAKKYQMSEDDKATLMGGMKAEDKTIANSDDKMVKCAERAFSKLIAPVLQTVTTLKNQLAPVTDGLKKQSQEAKRAKIQTFCEARVKEGKILPFEMDPRDKDGKPLPGLVDRLMERSDDKVLTFSEGKVSPLQAELDAIDARPPLASFAERHQQPLRPKAGMTPERRKELLGSTLQGQAILRKDARK